jgi:hypothetical protein
VYSKTLAVGIIVLFIGVSVFSGFAVGNRTSSSSSINIFERNNSSKISINADENETFGVYMGLIIGRICNLQGSNTRVTFIASSVTIYPSGQKLTNVDAWVKKPYLGFITTKYILILGIIYSGW